MGKISLFSLVLLVVAAIDSIRNLPMTALFGSSLVFFFLLSAVVFLIPISLVSAEFSSRYPEQGGVFHWVRHAFGEKIGMLAVWLQWINTMVWYPTILSFIAGTAAYLVNPELAQNKLFLSVVILAIFWGLTILNMRGIRVSAKVNSFCGTIGTLFPMSFLIVLGLGWVLSGNEVAVSFSRKELIPSLSDAGNWSVLIAIMASFLGMELAGVHVGDIENPQKNFPKAMGISVLILLATMIFGSLAIAVVIPKNELHLVDGIMQSFTTFFTAFHIRFLIPVLAVLIIIGSAGGMINWLLSPAKGLLQSAEFGFFPRYFTIRNKYGTSVRILITQAILVSLFALAIIFMPSINAFYWFMTALSTGLYMLMYALLFLSALKLGRPHRETMSYRIPRGLRTLCCVLGLLGCAATIIVGFQHPEGVDVGSDLRYGLSIAFGNLILIAPVLLLWLYQSVQKKKAL
ncbi:MAG TPA: APC family permease [Chlamydiales bacterium]|jgi:amino acid transporter|nr:APC family permease [Chlamydiales bacterium]